MLQMNLLKKAWLPPKKKVRRGLLRKFFGDDLDKITIIIPKDSVKDVTICEVDERGAADAKWRQA